MSLFYELEQAGLEEYVPENTVPNAEEKGLTTEKIHRMFARDEIDTYNPALRDEYEPDFGEYAYDEKYNSEDDEEDDDQDDYYEYYNEETDEVHRIKAYPRVILKEERSYKYDDIETFRVKMGLYQYDEDEIYNLHIENLFGVTKNELKFLDYKLIRKLGLEKVVTVLSDAHLKNEFPDAKQRTAYALKSAAVNADGIQPPTISPELAATGYRHPKKTYDDCHEYVKRIVLKHDAASCKNLIEWLRDYYSMWSDAKVIDEERAARGERTFGYPLCPKPSRLKDYHDKAIRDSMEMDSRRAIEKKEDVNKRIKLVTKDKDYTSKLCRGDKYSILPVTCAEDLLFEGKYLHHCVGSYVNKVADGETYIYFLRFTDNPKVPYYTLEVSGMYETEKYLLQCYTDHDTIDKLDDCRNFIEKWARRNIITISCEI